MVRWTSPDGGGGGGGQLKVELPPLTMELGLAVKLTVGAGAAQRVGRAFRERTGRL